MKGGLASSKTWARSPKEASPENLAGCGPLEPRTKSRIGACGTFRGGGAQASGPGQVERCHSELF